jgi:hypothetical protein
MVQIKEKKRFKKSQLMEMRSILPLKNNLKKNKIMLMIKKMSTPRKVGII